MDKKTKKYIIVGAVGAGLVTLTILLTSKKASASTGQRLIKDVASFDDLLPIVQKYSNQYGVPVALVFAIMQQESPLTLSKAIEYGVNPAWAYEKGYFDTKATLMQNPTEIKSGGSQGLMQILLSSARALGYDGDASGLYDPDTGIKYGVLYIKYIHDHFGVDYSDVADIASYYNSNKPYTSAPSSTRNTYVPHVMKYYSYYADKLASIGISSPIAQALPSPSTLNSGLNFIDTLKSWL